MTRHLSLEKELLDDFEYPVALVIEITKQGVRLSKLRYLKGLGQIINETIRCPCIEVYAHMGSHLDPYLTNGHAKPVGIDWIFTFSLKGSVFNEAVRDIRSGHLTINTNNPKTRDIAKGVLDKVHKHSRVSYKKLNPLEQGLILEPYCKCIFDKVGDGPSKVLQNVEIVNRENALRVRGAHQDDFYYPRHSPTMEIDLLVFTEIRNVRSILDGIREYGFIHDQRIL